LLSKAEEAVSQTSDLSGGKMKPDHLTLGMFFSLKGDFVRAAGELEEYLRKSPDSTDAAAIRAEVKRLRDKDVKKKTSSP
jgi:Tfp pilus assembly protein PilF